MPAPDGLPCSSSGRALPSERDAPDEQPEQSGDHREREPLRRAVRPCDGHALTMNTGVPTSTRSKSHSTSGISMRTHPCEAEYPIDQALNVP